MRKKKTPAPAVTEVRPVRTRQAKKTARCTVCGAEVAPFSTENLCWVCRRLKISAWRDNDSQLSAQE